MRNTKSVTNLRLWDLTFEELLDPVQAAQNLSASIALNTSIEVLICYEVENVRYKTVILTGLAEHRRIGELELYWWEPDLLGGSAMLLKALKRNCSLFYVSSYLAGNEMRAEMKFYATRNKQIHAILEAPEEKLCELLQVWPRVLQNMRECAMEASIIFLVLKALGDSVGPRDRLRKWRYDRHDSKKVETVE